VSIKDYLINQGKNHYLVIHETSSRKKNFSLINKTLFHFDKTNGKTPFESY